MSAAVEPAGGAREALFEPMRRVSRRSRLRDTLAAVLAGLIAGLAVIGAAEIAALVGATLPPVVPFAAVASLLVGAAVALVLWRRRPAGAALAFRIDRRAGFGEAYGTAIDVAGREETPGPVGQVLLEHLAPRARSLDTSRIEPLFPRPVIVLAAVAAVLLLAVGLSLGLRQGAAPAPAAAPRPLEEAEPEDPEAALQAAAERMAADAEETGDAYLEAVARAIEDRLEQARAGGGEISSAEAEDLLEHAARAYGEDQPDWLGEGAGERLAGLGDRLEEEARQEAARAARAEQEADRPPGMYDRPPDMAERYVGRGEDELRSDPNAPSGEAAASSDPGLTGGGGEDEPRRMDSEDLQFAGRVPVGAALQSGRGESNMAGLGSQDLQEDADFAGLAAETGETILLGGQASPDGNRIRIELPPEVEAAAAAEAAAAGFASGGAEGPAAGARARSVVSLEGRDMVARYLGRGTTCEGAGC
ncbi:hypothetical protein [Pseudoroseicyclus tamaricis]|uniref:Uncharacterized protein n=1 Tax=Pseudoroseicyclus tamaricis TaxID=2705421 RepID=A0A6B2JT40_9RHOB|nr:hypothetical protein [Pseudoroseicyclus tamaricis]NDV01190.1 hypothetical protein [Pseudoroseicyclus tamaricis]